MSMRRFAVILLFCLSARSASAVIYVSNATGPRTLGEEYHDCAYDVPGTVPTQTIYLWGDVKVVQSAKDADLLVYVSKDGFCDLRVKLVTHKPSCCGEWRIVDSKAEFTIMYVDSPKKADLIISYGDPCSEYNGHNPF